MAKSFRPIAIRILYGCAPNIRKILHAETTYFFSNNYDECENIHTLKRLCQLNKAEGSLYNVECYNNHKIEVSVNAVVGKNGEGKSTLVEILIRIINNFSYTYGFLQGQETLAPVSGLNAILYYEFGNTVYAIECRDLSTVIYKDGDLLSGFNPESTDKDRKVFLKQIVKDGLFYTIIENYSLYAYNSKILDIESEGYGSWIKGLFHKNDAYQTPLVINPMRSDGNINVNREASLSHQRLMAIFTQAETDVHRRINERQYACGFAFSKEQESKLISNTIFDYFEQVQGDFVEWSVMELYDNVDVENDAEKFKCFWEDFCKVAFENEALFDVVKQYAVQLEISEHQETDLNRYLKKIEANYSGNIDVHMAAMLSAFTKGEYKWMNYKQFYRLWCIMMVWSILKKERLVRRYLKNSLNYNLEHRTNTRNAAELYVLYKVMSIVETYEDYSQYGLLYTDSYDTLINDKSRFGVDGMLHSSVNSILHRNDYVTLKLRQTLNFLKREDNDDVYGANDCQYDGINYDYYIPFDNLKSHIAKTSKKSSLSDVIQFLPPPIFVGEILITDGHDVVRLNSLSSGETQRLNSVGSTIYHLRNLDDKVSGAANIQYRKVMIVFEEVELYFHPDYQRTYLSFLLNQIKQTNFKHLTHISMMLVTHSPFVLSDVLPSQLCCLSEGIQKRNVVFETFGANIYELLRNPFFLKEKGVIGGYAQQVINEIVEDLGNARRGDIHHTDKSILLQRIKLIDEPLMRNALIREYNSIFQGDEDVECQINRLKSEIKRLKEKQRHVASRS